MSLDVRVLFAGLFVFGGLLALVVLCGSLGALDGPGPIAKAGFVIAPLVLIAAAWMLFNRHPLARSDKSNAEIAVELERAGQLTRAEFEVRRAFRVEEFEDEGQSWFLELADGGVLFLSGQYLDEYEPDDDTPRTFPRERFTLLRHATEGYAVDIRSTGAVLEPEAIAPPFTTREHELDRVPTDGTILRDVSYDEIKARWTSSRRAAAARET